jgi:predicted secreted protein
MNWVTGTAVYVIVWWLVIFMVLPWGVRPISDEDVARGHASGAPQRHGLKWKLVVTTLISAAIWGVIYLIIESDAISFRT